MQAQQGGIQVRLGSRVTVQFADGSTEELMIRCREPNLPAGIITATSPLGRSLLGARASERVTYFVHRVPQTVVVLSVHGPES
jgi:transcription elongation GreA/GreB family factor